MHWKPDFLVFVASSLFLTLICITSADAQSTKLTVVTNLGVPAILVEPDPLGPRSHIGIVTMHSDGNYLSGSNCIPLAQRGYRALCMNNQFTNNADNIEGFYQIAPAIGRGMNHLRGLVGANGKVGVTRQMGGPLMTFYQNAAENGPSACRGPQIIYPCPDEGLTNLPKADFVILRDSHGGSGFANLSYRFLPWSTTKSGAEETATRHVRPEQWLRSEYVKRDLWRIIPEKFPRRTIQTI